MAVTKVSKTGKLVLKVRTGMNGAKEIYKNRTFAGLKSTALDADIYAIGQALADLQQYTPVLIQRFEEAELQNS